MSQAVKRLEDELGERLFDRTSRNGTLTEAGALLLEHARRLLRLAAEAEAAVRELHHVRHGTVVIGANEAAVHSLLPFIRAFAQQSRICFRRPPIRIAGKPELCDAR